jgi:hypothetical protein
MQTLTLEGFVPRVGKFEKQKRWGAYSQSLRCWQWPREWTRSAADKLVRRLNGRDLKGAQL